MGRWRTIRSMSRRNIAIAIFHGLGDCVNATTLLRPVKKKFPGCHIKWVSSEAYIPVVANNPLVDERQPIQGETYLSHAKPHIDRLRRAHGPNLIVPAPYFNPPSKDGTLLGSFKERIRTYGRPGEVFEPLMYPTPQEEEEAHRWLEERQLERFVMVECVFGSSQSFWSRKHSDILVQMCADHGLGVVFTHREDPGLSQFNSITPSYCMDLHYRLAPPIYNRAAAFVGVSSGISCIVHAQYCRKDVPHLEVVGGDHWATAHYAKKRKHFLKRNDISLFRHELSMLLDEAK